MEQPFEGELAATGGRGLSDQGLGRGKIWQLGVVPLNVGPRLCQLCGKYRWCRAHVVTTSASAPVFRFRAIPNNLHVPVSCRSCVLTRAGALICGELSQLTPRWYVATCTPERVDRAYAPGARTTRATGASPGAGRGNRQYRGARSAPPTPSQERSTCPAPPAGGDWTGERHRGQPLPVDPWTRRRMRSSLAYGGSAAAQARGIVHSDTTDLTGISADWGAFHDTNARPAPQARGVVHSGGHRVPGP